MELGLNDTDMTDLQNNLNRIGGVVKTDRKNTIKEPVYLGEIKLKDLNIVTTANELIALENALKTIFDEDGNEKDLIV